MAAKEMLDRPDRLVREAKKDRKVLWERWDQLVLEGLRASQALPGRWVHPDRQERWS